MPSLKLLTLGGRSFSEWGSDHVACSFAYKGGQYNRYATQRLNHITITLFTRPKFVDAPLTLIFKMG